MKTIITLLLLIQTILLSGQTENQKDYILNKVLFFDATADQKDPAWNLLIKVTDSELLDLDSRNKLIYVKSTDWEKDKNLITDLRKKPQMSQFFLNTSIRTMVTHQFQSEKDGSLYRLKLISILDQKVTEKEFRIGRNPIESIETFRKELTSWLEKEIQPISRKKLQAEILDQTSVARDNPDYELVTGGGTGFRSSVLLGKMFNNGPNVNFFISSKIKAFYMKFYAEFAALIAIPSSDLASLYETEFNPSLFTGIDLGGYFYSEIFRLSFGSAYYFTKAYLKDQSANSTVLSNLYAHMLYFYLQFSVQPNRKTSFALDLGSFFCTNSNRILPMKQFPFYLTLSFNYYFYQNTFIQISVPFHIIQYMDQSGNETEPGFVTMIQLNFGHRFEWRKK
jgi:hypothetical protein